MHNGLPGIIQIFASPELSRIEKLIERAANRDDFTTRRRTGVITNQNGSRNCLGFIRLNAYLDCHMKQPVPVYFARYQPQ